MNLNCPVFKWHCQVIRWTSSEYQMADTGAQFMASLCILGPVFEHWLENWTIAPFRFWNISLVFRFYPKSEAFVIQACFPIQKLGSFGIQIVTVQLFSDYPTLSSVARKVNQKVAKFSNFFLNRLNLFKTGLEPV